MHGISGPPAEPISLTVNLEKKIIQFEVDDQWMKIILDLSEQAEQFSVIIRNDDIVLRMHPLKIELFVRE